MRNTSDRIVELLFIAMPSKQPRYKSSVAAQIQIISRSSPTDECHDRTVKANSPENMTRQIVCNRQSDEV
ncbi:hypothetical protein BgiMline_022674 [Biomphalaria glabrata]|nr:hypothetical protein BgiMline_010495 [Biomphalaria glabrata]